MFLPIQTLAITILYVYTKDTLAYKLILLSRAWQIPYVAKCSRSIIFANFANGAHSRILLFANFYVRRYTVYIYICVRTIITTVVLH